MKKTNCKTRKTLTKKERTQAADMARHIQQRAKVLGIPAEDFLSAVVLIGIPGTVLKSRGGAEDVVKIAGDCAREAVHVGAKIGATLAGVFAFKKGWLTKEQAAKAIVEGIIAGEQI